MSRGETSSIVAGGFQPIERRPSSFAHALVSWDTLEYRLFADVFMPEPSPALLSCLWSTKAQRWACLDLLQARRWSSISRPRGRHRGWGMRYGDYSGSAHFQLITRGERARLWAVQKMDTDPLASWGLLFSPLEHLSGCNINPSPALSSPLRTMEPFHPWVIPAKLAYTVEETPMLVP